jgi:hypothetical protein
MRRFLSKWAATVGSSSRGQGSGRRNCDFRPALEALEERQVLSTLFLTPGGHDATHFSTFQAAYNAARPGDVIQVEPGAVVSDPSGTISIDKSITLRGDPAFGRAPVAGNVTVTVDLFNQTTVVLQHLDLGNGSVTAPGSNSAALAATIEDSTLHNVQEDGAGLGTQMVIHGNTITGSVSIDHGQGGDQVTNNTFLINDAGTHAAIVVTDQSCGTIISGNTIEFHTQSAANEGLVLDDQCRDVVVTGNTFDTNRVGTGLVIGELVNSVKVEGNDFNANRVGVAIDGIDRGSIDLGGGPLGSRGLNSFISYGGNDGRLAIVLTDSDPTYTVHARGNYWSPCIDPHSVIEDGSHHGGTGIIDVEMNTVCPGARGGSGLGTSVVSLPVGDWPSSWNAPGSAAAASHPHGHRMM